MKESVASEKRTASASARRKAGVSSPVFDEQGAGNGPLMSIVQRAGCSGCAPTLASLAGRMAGMPAGSRKEAALSLQRARGNRFVQGLAVQAKLMVGPDEKELRQGRLRADGVAAELAEGGAVPSVPADGIKLSGGGPGGDGAADCQVGLWGNREMNHQMVAQAEKKSFRPSAGGLLQRKCDRCREKEKTLQRSAVGSAPETVPPIVHEVLRSPGQPLDVATRAFMEPRFGHDFSQVRVHTDAKAAESVRSVNALAFTLGNNIVFGLDQYVPKTPAGRLLLAHELAHVIQQGNIDSGTPTELGNVSHHYEQEAVEVSLGALANSKKKIPTMAGKSSEARTVRRGLPIIIAGAAGAGGAYAYREYKCLKQCEEPMHSETSDFRLWYFNRTRSPVPGRIWDAFGHCFVACCGTKRCGASSAFIAGQGRELYRSSIDSEPHDSYKQDTNNQKIGRSFGDKEMDCRTACRDAVMHNKLDLSAPISMYWKPPDDLSFAPFASWSYSWKSDADIRYWILKFKDKPGAIGSINVQEKIRMIKRLMGGWISDKDISVIELICKSVTSTGESAEIRRSIRPMETSISNFGQRMQVRVALQKMP